MQYRGRGAKSARDRCGVGVAHITGRTVRRGSKIDCRLTAQLLMRVPLATSGATIPDRDITDCSRCPARARRGTIAVPCGAFLPPTRRACNCIDRDLDVMICICARVIFPLERAWRSARTGKSSLALGRRPGEGPAVLLFPLLIRVSTDLYGFGYDRTRDAGTRAGLEPKRP